MLELVRNVAIGVLFVCTSMGLVALSAYIAITPSLHPGRLVRDWLARQTARHAMARFDKEWDRYTTSHDPDRS